MACLSINAQRVSSFRLNPYGQVLILLSGIHAFSAEEQMHVAFKMTLQGHAAQQSEGWTLLWTLSQRSLRGARPSRAMH